MVGRELRHQLDQILSTSGFTFKMGNGTCHACLATSPTFIEKLFDNCIDDAFFDGVSSLIKFKWLIFFTILLFSNASTARKEFSYSS